MSEITKLRLWNDPGFTEGTVEVPKYDNIENLPNPTMTLDDSAIVPSKSRFFSELKLKVPYSDAQYLSYLEMTVEYNDDKTCVYYGYIDAVNIGSDNVDYPQVSVLFHIDLWRTYLKQAVFGYGMVKRRPRGTNDPIQALTPRYRKVSDKVFPLVPDTMIGGGAYWAIINYTYESTDHKTTEARVIIVPVAKDPSVVYYMKLDANGTKYQVPTLEDWILGEYDEILGLAPSSISSVFLSPIPPLKLFSGTGSINDPFVVVGSSPSPTPTVRTYSGNNQPRAYRITNDFEAELTNGVKYYTREWNGATVYSISGAEADVYGQGTIELRGRVRVNGSDVLATDGDNVRTISAMPIDAYMRSVLGEATFGTLQNGDTVVFSNVYGVYASGSLRTEYQTSSYDGAYDWQVDLPTASPSGSVFTYNNGSFGGGWVVVDGEFSTSSVTLTTYSDAPTTAEYGFMVPEHQTADPKFAVLFTKTDRFAEYSASLMTEISTSDTEQFVATDLDGSVIATLPWGLKIKDYTFRCVISATSGYVQFRFDGLNSSAEGLQVTFPLPALDITSNSWSSYLYSGQREYDIAQRKIARDKALVDGIGSAISGGAQGAMMGALREGMSDPSYSRYYQDFMTPTARSVATAGAFGALGAGAGLASSALGYASAEYFNDKLQGARDQLQAKQLDSITASGNGPDWLYHGRPYQIRTIVPDDYSLSRFNKDIELNGISVSEPVENCTDLIRGSGPLAIENLIVRGNIPVEAKQYIKDKLDKGVRLK